MADPTNLADCDRVVISNCIGDLAKRIKDRLSRHRSVLVRPIGTEQPADDIILDVLFTTAAKWWPQKDSAAGKMKHYADWIGMFTNTLGQMAPEVLMNVTFTKQWELSSIVCKIGNAGSRVEMEAESFELNA